MSRRRSPRKWSPLSNIEPLEARVYLAAAGDIQIIDDGQTGFTLSGNGWNELGPNYRTHNGDFFYHVAGDGAASAEWEFENAQPGWHDVAVSYLPQTNRARNVLYRIFDGNTLRRTVLVDQQQTIQGVVDGTQRWHSLGRIESTDGTIRIVVTDRANGIVTVDAARISRLPDLRLGSGESLWEVSEIDLGSQFNVREPWSFPLTSRESESVRLRLLDANGREIDGSSDWITIEAGGSATLEIPPDPFNSGDIQTFSIEVAGHDFETAPVSIRSEFLSTKSVSIGDPEFQSSGSSWIEWGSDGQLLANLEAQPGDSASWQFENLGGGTVAIWIPFSIGLNSRFQLLSHGEVFAEVPWDELRELRQIASGDVTRLGNFDVPSSFELRLIPEVTGAQLFAGEVQLSRTSELSLSLLENGRHLHSGDVIQLSKDYPVQTILLTNSGTDTLWTHQPVHVPYELQVLGEDGSFRSGDVTPFADPFAPGETRRLVIRRNPTIPSASEAVLTFPPGGPYGSPIDLQFRFPDTFDVVLDETPTAGWTHRSAPWFDAIDNDFQYAGANWADVETRWEFTDLPQGAYDIWGTWIAGANRSTAVPFSWEADGRTDEFSVNQQLRPDDDSSHGVAWEKLGTVNVFDGTLTVSLTNHSAAPGLVIADAIRLTQVAVFSGNSILIDNGVHGDGTVDGNWTPAERPWFDTVNHNFLFAHASDFNQYVTWQSPLLPAGTYEFLASYQSGANRTTHASYEFHQGSTHLGTAWTNQVRPASDVFVGGQGFESLRSLTLADAGSVTIRLNSRANSGIVVADAILIRQIHESTKTSEVSILPPSQPSFRIGETALLKAQSTLPGTKQYRFWLQDPQGEWRLVRQFSTNPHWPWQIRPGEAGTYQVKVDVQRLDGPAIHSATASIEVRPTEEMLWDSTVAPLLEEDLWYFDYRYDAANFLLVPMMHAFQNGNTERIQQFADHFARLVEHGIERNGITGELSWFQYLSLPAKFIAEAGRHRRTNMLPAGLVDYMYAELERFWHEEPAWHWSLPSFANMQERLEWKLAATDLARSYHAAIIDHETFLMEIAADLRTYEQFTGTTHADSASVTEILDVTYRVFEQRGTWNNGEWSFQIGVWDDLIDFAYLSYDEVTDDLQPTPAVDSAPDSAHAHRIPAVLASLLTAYPTAAPEWSFYDQIRRGHESLFWNQVLIGPASDFQGYRMTNYMDGRNGLYRVGPRGALPGPFAYEPYELSGRFLYGWWTLLGTNRIRETYAEQARLFPLAENVLETYNGPPDFRPTHELTRLESAFENGFLELTTWLASQLRS
ncbi:MAG: hypothetical protein KDA80_18695 [Planctomycetaceae bacterium]|nr:hypothetical protein [Planctomycetaceae bacterium]